MMQPDNFFTIKCQQNYSCSEAKLSVSGASNKLDEWLSTRFFPRASSTMGQHKIWHKGGLGDADDAWTSNTCTAQRNHAIPHSTMQKILYSEK